MPSPQSPIPTAAGFGWGFASEDARIKLKHFYLQFSVDKLLGLAL
jgi:hypothetical protein